MKSTRRRREFEMVDSKTNLYNTYLIRNFLVVRNLPREAHIMLRDTIHVSLTVCPIPNRC